MAEKQPKTLNDKLCAIQVKLKAKKDKWNAFGKYNYRSAEGILESLKPHLDTYDCSLTITEDLGVIGDSTVMFSTATLSDGKDELKANAIVGIDFEQRGMNVPQKFGSASSYAKKYALGNLFLIDDTADSDATNEHGKGNAKVAAKIKAVTKPTMSKEQFDKAKAYIESGGDLSAIETKYKINTQHLVDLKKAVADVK
tara:strand:+ start:1824 stop:2417 length:594 start_codon:yes stop_codon:yes gene_type:complete